MSIEQALKKTVICEKEYDSIKKIIETKGLQNVNAFFYYQDEEIRKIDKSKIYNNLHYVGEFEKLSYG
jgi:hypothetical protein